MKKKILICSIVFSLFAVPAFSTVGFEFGIGSGYVFYNDKNTKEVNKKLADGKEAILTTDALFLLQMNDFLIFTAGGDAVFDFRWNDGNHVNLVDYSFLIGARIYPNLAGLFFSADYALGRRTDFISLDDYEDRASTKWGNGFKLAIGYDFSYHLSSFAPLLSIALKSMPRGNARDNLLSISLKLTKHK